MAASPRPLSLVLFDLDGTLVDSAPDLAGAANALRAEHGLEPLPYQQLRPLVGTGARGMVGAAFGLGPQDIGYEVLRSRFLTLYEQRMLQETRVFQHIHVVLDALDAAGLRWGIVTNKAERLARPIVEGLGLSARSAVLIGGDTTAQAKPHPLPLLEAARRLACDPARAAYVGDDLRDVQAGLAAGMQTLAAAWGYLGLDHPIETWGAHAVLQTPAEVLAWAL
jgi:phosphoglycolate phosphatase